MGEMPHAEIQGFLARVFGNNELDWKIRALPEQRVQISAKRYRIADLCIVRRETPFEAIVRTPPLLCIEILSRDDRMSRIQERVGDYTGMGVGTVWVIDPRRRKAYQAASDGVMRELLDELTVPDSPIALSVAEIFARLDWMGA